VAEQLKGFKELTIHQNCFDNNKEDMKIRMLLHDAQVAPFDARTFMTATRGCVYAELPSGVAPGTCSAVQHQSSSSNNQFTITIERNKNLLTADYFYQAMMASEDMVLNDGALGASKCHEVAEIENMLMDKPGFALETYHFSVPSSMNVELGFRNRNDLVSINNKSNLMFQSAELQDAHGNSYTSYYVFFYFLAWTPEQFENMERQKLKLRGKGKVRQAGQKIVFGTPSNLDYSPGGDKEAAEAEVSEKEDTPPIPKKRTRSTARKSTRDQTDSIQNATVVEIDSPEEYMKKSF
jgi:hypothetical protein